MSAPIVHTHSTYCTALAIARKAIPACHYMIAAFGGTDIRCADYATLRHRGAVRDTRCAALEGRSGCLLANHGMIATGPTSTRRCGSRSSWRPSPGNITSRCDRRPGHAQRRRDRRGHGEVQELRPRPQAPRPTPSTRSRCRARRRKRGELSEEGGDEAADGARSTSSSSAAASTAPASRAMPPGAGSGCCCARRTISRGHLVALRQARPWRPALSRILRVPPGARGADRARGAAARRRRTSSGRCASCCRTARSSGRPGWCGSGCFSTTISAAASAAGARERSTCAARRRARRSARSIASALRIFRLLGRRCAPRRPQRARRAPSAAPRS